MKPPTQLVPIWVAGHQVTGEHTTPITPPDGGDPVAEVADPSHVEEAVQTAQTSDANSRCSQPTAEPTRSTTSRAD